MESQNEVLHIMDLLDLDEELIDLRLKSLISKSELTEKHLTNITYLLKYKELINLQEKTECENNEEFTFVGKLLQEVNETNVEAVGKIIRLVLTLNPSSIVSKAEHLLHQIISNIDIPGEYKESLETYDDTQDLKTLQYLKICSSILDALIAVKEKVSLLFLEVPIEKLIFSPHEQTMSYFLTCYVPKFFEAVSGYNVLDKIWELIMVSGDNCRDLALKVLCTLSNYYLPIADENKVLFQSTMTHQNLFWDLILFGLKSNDPSIRKLSLYLAKRAIDCLLASKTNIVIKSDEEKLIVFNAKEADEFKKMWENYFILIESLEEKQSNIVLPSLLLFEVLDKIGESWLNSAFKLGIEHDNSQVRLKCLEYRLIKPIKTVEEAKIILEALNDLNYYDNPDDCNKLNEKKFTSIKGVNNLNSVLKAIPLVKWSPVPLYNVSKILSNLVSPDISLIYGADELTQIIIDILKVPCNNVPLRRAIYIHISYFLANNCSLLGWKEFLNIFPYFHFEKMTEEGKKMNPLINKIKTIVVDPIDREVFFQMITETKHIDFTLLYLEGHHEDVFDYMNKVHDKISSFENILNRQYSKKQEAYDDYVFITHLFSKTQNKDCFKVQVKVVLKKQAKNIVKYIIELMSAETDLNEDEIRILFQNFDDIIADINADLKEILLSLHKTAVIILQDPFAKPNQLILSIFALRALLNNNFKVTFSHEMVNVNNMFKIHDLFYKNDRSLNEGNGKMRNSFYEKLCEILYRLLIEDKREFIAKIDKSVELIENVTDYGGYGCLIWILKMINHILQDIIDSNIDFNIPKFIERMWSEIEELKTSQQYSPCMEEFVELITNEALLKKSCFNNSIIFYCKTIIEYGVLKNTPLYFLCKKLHNIDIDQESGIIIFVLSEILLFSPVPKKDQRIADNFALEVLQNPKMGINVNSIDYRFDHEIQWLAISILAKIRDPEVFSILNSLIINNIDAIFKNKMRYHGNSQSHRQLMFALQNLLFTSLLNPLYKDRVYNWCLELLGKIPHQPSARLCLEWYIALHIVYLNDQLDENLISEFNSAKIPIISQFMILYWVVKSRNNAQEVEFVMDTLLSHTMGQMFNVRLHAQYLATKLYRIIYGTQVQIKYAYTIGVIEKTFKESCKDKNFVKLNQDYFANEFDLKGNFTPPFIYYFIPKYFEITLNENMDLNVIRNAIKGFQSNVNKVTIEDVLTYKFDKNHDNNQNVDAAKKSGTIQKKYIPWKSMSDIDVYDMGNKAQSPSELIVVASLIDKLPNLGGMARTGEVFGVKTYVIDSLRHLQDRQFQGLSVSAERWIDVKEVRPGDPLKEYLLSMKAEGYSVVAAEQTSTSSKLQSFKFPKKTLLLLGHEKDGIPCDLLPMMDYCVEIPQHGYVRSLNVHVTAAIFVWEYSRQNIL